MPPFEMTDTSFRAVPEKTFTDMGISERSDIQRLLRTQIEVLGDELHVLTEEFGEWDDSKRRIDLLAVDKKAQLVVIELKRTADGGHMELQAIRYASMVAAMTFDRDVDIHAAFLQRMGQPPEEAKARLFKFLGWNEPDEENFAGDVRIVLVSEGFSKEVTTAVLWLRDRDIDIRCIRLRPYVTGDKTLVDVQQVIPLPEAQDYMIRIRQKEQQERKNRAERWSAEAKQFCVDGPLRWNVDEDREQGSLSCPLPDFDANDTGDWPRQHKMLAEKIIELYRVVNPYVRPLLNGTSGSPDA